MKRLHWGFADGSTDKRLETVSRRLEQPPPASGLQPPGYLTAMVAVLLLAPLWVMTTGTASPAAAPAGTCAFTW